MKRFISAILIPCLLLQLYGCYSFQNISTDELYFQKERDDISFVDSNGYKYLFRAQDYAISNDSLEGKGLKSKIDNDFEKELFKGKYAISDMKLLKADRVDGAVTLLLVGGIIGAFIFLGKLASESNPFIN